MVAVCCGPKTCIIWGGNRETKPKIIQSFQVNLGNFYSWHSHYLVEQHTWQMTQVRRMPLLQPPSRQKVWGSQRWRRGWHCTHSEWSKCSETNAKCSLLSAKCCKNLSTLNPSLSNRNPKKSRHDPFMTLWRMAATARNLSSDMYSMA